MSTIHRWSLDKAAPGLFRGPLGGWVKYPDHVAAVEAAMAGEEEGSAAMVRVADRQAALCAESIRGQKS